MQGQPNPPLPENCGCKNGNEGMRSLTQQIRSLGFRWGSYSNMAGCQTPECDIPSLNQSKYNGFVQQDAALYLDEWQSDYLMVDSVGNAPPKGKDYYSWMHFLIQSWADTIRGYYRGARRSIVFHACHAGCSSAFTGPTLYLHKCDPSDPEQGWHMPKDSSHLRNAGSGLCVGCTNGPCADAAGVGLGLQGATKRT